MATHRLGIIMHGVTGRMGYNQHLVRSILAIREQGGVVLPNGDRVMPDPILVGRNADKIEAIAARHGITRISTDLDAALANPDDTLFFDAGSTQMRADLLTKAIEAGKHVYCEKPIAERLTKRWRWRGWPRRAASRTAWCRTSSILPGLRKLAHAARLRLLRPHPLGARRVRLLGVRRRLAAGAAAELELPQGRRRRHHPRYAVPLALCARQSVRRGESGLLPRRHPYSRARRRGRQALHGRRRRCRLCDVRARRRRRSRTSIRPGACACAATTSSPSRSTARMARRSPA